MSQYHKHLFKGGTTSIQMLTTLNHGTEKWWSLFCYKDQLVQVANILWPSEIYWSLAETMTLRVTWYCCYSNLLLRETCHSLLIMTQGVPFLFLASMLGLQHWRVILYVPVDSICLKTSPIQPLQDSLISFFYSNTIYFFSNYLSFNWSLYLCISSLSL